MPEAHHYEDEALNRAYVYSNIQSIAIKQEIYNPNILKSVTANRKESYSQTFIRSYYRNRVDYGDITSSFIKHLSMFFVNTLESDKLVIMN